MIKLKKYLLNLFAITYILYLAYIRIFMTHLPKNLTLLPNITLCITIFDRDYLRVKHNYAETQELLYEAETNLKRKLADLARTPEFVNNTAYIDDYTKIDLLKQQYISGEIDLNFYIKRFWELYDQNMFWICDTDITLNVPQLLNLNDFDHEKLKNIEEQFVFAFCGNMQDDSELYLLFKKYLLENPQIDLKSGIYQIFRFFYNLIFP